MEGARGSEQALSIGRNVQSNQTVFLIRNGTDVSLHTPQLREPDVDGHLINININNSLFGQI